MGYHDEVGEIATSTVSKVVDVQVVQWYVDKIWFIDDDHIGVTVSYYNNDLKSNPVIHQMKPYVLDIKRDLLPLLGSEKPDNRFLLINSVRAVSRMANVMKQEIDTVLSCRRPSTEVRQQAIGWFDGPVAKRIMWQISKCAATIWLMKKLKGWDDYVRTCDVTLPA